MDPGKTRRHSLLPLTKMILLCIVFSAACGCITNSDNGSDGNPAGNDIDAFTPVEETPAEEHTGEDETPETKIPKIVPVEITGKSYEDRTFNVKFEKSEYELILPVNLSVYNGAKNADKAITPGTLWNETDKVSAYYRSFFEGGAIDGFYTDILKKIRHVKIAEGFSDEEYLEFLVTFVQQIPYDSEAEQPRFPVEVVYDMKGDCDEKSMLLIGMLAREGYDTALIIFPEYRHATAGIRIITSADTSFRQFKAKDGRKYVYIESTTPQYIGQYPEELGEANAIVVPVGDGDKTFERYNYVSYITESLTKINNRIVFLDFEMQILHDEINGLASDLNNKKYVSDNEWHTDHAKYLNLLDQYYEYQDLLEKNVEVYNYIVEHSYDVEGVRRYIYNSKVNEMEY